MALRKRLKHNLRAPFGSRSAAASRPARVPPRAALSSSASHRKPRAPCPAPWPCGAGHGSPYAARSTAALCSACATAAPAPATSSRSAMGERETAPRGHRPAEGGAPGAGRGAAAAHCGRGAGKRRVLVLPWLHSCRAASADVNRTNC